MLIFHISISWLLCICLCVPISQAGAASFQIAALSRSSIDNDYDDFALENSQMLPISSQSLNGHNSASRRAGEVLKKEIHQNLTPKNMSKSNPVHLWRFGCTRALIFTQKWLYRPGWHLQKKQKWQNKKIGTIIKKNPVSGRAMVKGKMSHFVAFFVHFDKLIRPHPGPLCPAPPICNHMPILLHVLGYTRPILLAYFHAYFPRKQFHKR